ncbi:MAG: M14 family zinc carboxypeptidase [Pseudomonadota bacterium]
MRLLPLFLLVLAMLSFADDRDIQVEMFPADVTYDPAIPTPESFLGFKLGVQPVRHHQMVEYITMVAEQSPRLSVEVIGYSHERRPILFVVATSEENRANLNEIREQHRRLSGDGEPPADLDDMPMVTWVNYGVHGSEASSMDTALPFIYHLAAAKDSETEAILDNSVLLVTAVFNPDGHAKRIAWVESYAGQRLVSDPNHIENRFSWAFARTNHYWFDLNRQWLLLTQPEPRAWMSKWHEWRPNLTVDYHEMGSNATYYFHPGEKTRTNPLALDEAERLMAETTRFSAEALDAEGALYWSGERFDNYYVGKGSTFPLINGGVGILYEAGAAMGRVIDSDNGLRSFRDNIRKQFRTSLASIRAGANLRTEYLAYQRDFYTSAIEEAGRYPTKAFVFSAGGDKARLDAFVDILTYHRIEVDALAADVTVDNQRFDADEALLVRLNQPQFRMIRTIFETVDTFEDATFYDVSTWTMPLAFNLDYASLDSRGLRGIRTASFDGVDIGPEAPSVPRSTYGYAVEWGSYYAPRAVSALLETGMLARVAKRPFQAFTRNGEVRFSRGDIVIPLERQDLSDDAIHAKLVEVAASAPDIRVHALTSGRSVNGTDGVNVGGPSFEPITAPRALLVVGNNVSRYDSGEIWHLMDYRMNMPVVLVDMNQLARLRWSDYTHLLLPNGSYDSVDETVKARLRTWIQEGGTAVGFRSGAQWLQALSAPPDELPTTGDENGEEEATERLDYAVKDQQEAVDVIGGAIFAGDLDTSHPLGFGYDDRDIALHRNSRATLDTPDNPYGVVIRYTDSPLLSGYTSQDNIDEIAGTPALVAQRSGRGAIILFADNPNFRGYWYGTNRLFLNSLFFSTAFDAPR